MEGGNLMAFNTSDTVEPKSSLQGRALSDDMFTAMRRLEIDGPTLAGGVAPNDLAVLNSKTSDATLLYSSTYDWPMENPIPDAMAKSRFFYNTRPDFTNATVFPDIPVGTNCNFIYFYQRQNTATSLGASGISDVPTTWRNATMAYRINMERTELSGAQQVGIVQGIEREMANGMSSAYVSTSTTTRQIDFQSRSTGANDGLVQADLEALGWSIVNATQMEKLINGFRWRVLHNAV